jgi:hypothetical protein
LFALSKGTTQMEVVLFVVVGVLALVGLRTLAAAFDEPD